MEAKDLVENALDTAKTVLAAGKSVCGTVYIHTDEGIKSVPYKCSSLPVEVEQAIIIHLLKALIRLGKLRGVVLLAEAWMARRPDDALAGVLRPALDPDREEVVIAWAYGQDGTKSAISCPIIRENGTAKIGDRNDISGGSRSWLDGAFVGD